MPSLLRRTLPCALLLAAAAPGLEVSLTVTGDVTEIQAVLEFIKTLDAGSAGGDDPLKINVHSIAAPGGAEAPGDAAVQLQEPPLSLDRAEVNPPKGAPGAPFIVTVNVRDKYDEVDTLSAHLNNTSLTTDLYDDGTHGDATAADGIWSATLVPLEVTPSGRYGVEISGYDKDGQALKALDAAGNVVPLTTNTELIIER